MTKFIKRYPLTFGALVYLVLCIPATIILYFVLGAESEHEILVNYLLPFICASIVATLFELYCTKSDNSDR